VSASSAKCRRGRRPSSSVSEQELMLCDIVWVPPQSHGPLSVKPHFLRQNHSGPDLCGNKAADKHSSRTYRHTCHTAWVKFNHLLITLYLLLCKTVFSETGYEDRIEWFLATRDRNTKRTSKLGQLHSVRNQMRWIWLICTCTSTILRVAQNYPNYLLLLFQFCNSATKHACMIN